MGERVFKTLDQQLDILISRGVNIKEEDKESAKDFLLKKIITELADIHLL